MISYNQLPPRISSYWLGYRTTDSKGKPTPALEDIPDCVDVVLLAFALVRPGNIIDTSFMCKPPNTVSTIKQGVKSLKQREKNVLLSVGGYGGNCWNNVTSEAVLASNILQVVDELGLDGVDIDYEGDNPLDDWMKLPSCPSPHCSGVDLSKLIPDLRSKLGLKGILTVVTTSDNTYIQATMDDLNWVSTMAYWNPIPLYKSMAKNYYQKNPTTPFIPIVLGVSCVDPKMALDDVIQCCQVHSPVGPLSMMLWDISEDCPGFTNCPTWTYVNTVNENLPKR
jgi:Glycosyl hydrolases family 18